MEDTDDLADHAMSKPAWGHAATFGSAGVYTTAGSEVNSTTRNLAAYAISGAGPRCCAVVAQYYGGSAFSLADELFDFLKTPKGYRSYYISGHSGMGFGLRFFGGYFGESQPLARLV